LPANELSRLLNLDPGREPDDQHGKVFARWIRDPFGSISAASIYYAESSGEFAPPLMTGDAEGYSDVRHSEVTAIGV
jgi:hypothetical protein